MSKTTLIVLLASILLILPAALSLRHRSLIDWDEGVFALQAQWLAHGFAAGKPFNFQTPPLFQIICALLFRSLSESGWILPLVSVISSAATLFLVYLLARELFDDVTGIYSVLLFMTTEFFLFFSRSGLSDAFFLFLFVAGLYTFRRGLTAGDNRSLIAAGICALLALYTKYSGPLLVLIFLVLGLTQGRSVSKRWIIFTVLAPLALYLPYLVLFLKTVSLPGVYSRHAAIAGINHLKYLFYVFRFAVVPSVIVTAGLIIARLRPAGIAIPAGGPVKPGPWLIVPALVVILLTGFYHPFFRLAYPAVPLLSMAAARFLASSGRFRTALLSVSLALALITGVPTLTYSTTKPADIARKAAGMAAANGARYLYTITPPNICLYAGGRIMVERSNPSTKISAFYDIYTKNDMIIDQDNNLLEPESLICVLAASFLTGPGFDSMIMSMPARLVDSTEFIDAPVYYRDAFNPLADERQVYKLYSVEIRGLSREYRQTLWRYAFQPRVDVIRLGTD